jgi:hypothetical protein
MATRAAANHEAYDLVIGIQRVSDWHAVYAVGGEIDTRAVQAVALVEEGDPGQPRRLVGLVLEDGDLVPAETVTGNDVRFCGYAGTGADLDEFRERARKWQLALAPPSSWFG